MFESVPQLQKTRAVALSFIHNRLECILRRPSKSKFDPALRELTMKVVIQRVNMARVEVNDVVVGEVATGLLILVGVGQGDTEREVAWLANKTVGLRIFQDAGGKMNRSIKDIGGAVLVVSQFTLLADCRKGRRPAFTDAAEPVIAEKLYEYYSEMIAEQGISVQKGAFGADMKVSLVNDGPVTIILDRVARDSVNHLV